MTGFSDPKETYNDDKILGEIGEFQELKNVLTENKVYMATCRKFLESCIRLRLDYCTAAQLSKELQDEMRKSRVNFKLVWFPETNGSELVWKRKTNFDGEEHFAFKYRISNLEEIVGTPTVRDFIYVRNLKYIAHV